MSSRKDGVSKKGGGRLFGTVKADAFDLDAKQCREYLEGLKVDVALQLEINRLELLASLVPSRIIRHHMKLSEMSKRVFSERFHAAVLFADISGFSNLAERLVKEINNAAHAAENLSRYIGASLEQMVASIANKGGDVIKFAGDAILAVFAAEDFGGSLEEATLCCSQVAMELVGYDFRVAGRNRTEVDGPAITLSVHCGVGCGVVVSYHVGGLNDRWEYVVTGSPVEQIGAAEPEAEAGQTVVSQQTHELLGEVLKGKKLPSGNFLLTGFSSGATFPTRKLILSELKAFTSKDPSQYKRLQDILRCYVPAPALVSIDSGNGIWSGELRNCTTVFCRLLGLKYEGRESDINAIQDSFSIVHKHTHAYEGTLLRFIVDDKGAGVLTAFGLPPNKHENDSVRAVKAAINIWDEFDELRKDRQKWKVGCSIGITTGEVFCGTVGGRLRCEYTLHGVKVNLAARLMVEAKKYVLCDKQTYSEAKAYFKFSGPKKISVKGKQGRIEVWRPKAAKKMVAPLEELPTSHQVGRKKEEELVKRLLRNVKDPFAPVPGTLIVTGDAGMGKTRLCQYALHKAKSRPFLTLIARGDDTEMHTPFFIWKCIVSQLLQYFVGQTKLSQLPNDELIKLLESRIPHQDSMSLVSGPRKSSTESFDSNDSSATDEFSHDSGEGRVPQSHARKKNANRHSGGSVDSGELDDDGLHMDVHKGLRDLFPLLRRILPDFFKLGPVSEGNKDSADSEVSLVNLLRLIVEIFAKAAKDLEQAERYFDVKSNEIEKNHNVIRVFIIVEDLQWADPYSVEALYRLAERGEPIAMMVTCRESMMFGAPSPRIMPTVEASPVGDVLKDWFQKLCSHNSTIKVTLQPLNLQEIQECLKMWIGADVVPARLVRVVYDKSQGHPFFAEELFKLMREDNIYSVLDTGECVLSKVAQGDDFGLPSTISDLMTSRLDRIPASQQLTLKVAAVIGNEFQMHVLASVLLRFTGDEDNEESILEDLEGDTPHPPPEIEAGRKKSVLKNHRSSINPTAMVRALRSSTTSPRPSSSSSRPKQTQSAAVAGDLREIQKLLSENIDLLIKRGFLVMETDSNGENVIRFSSVMLRESAYSLLLFKMRKSLHIKVAEFFEEKYEEYLQPVYLRLANHYFCADSFDRAMYYLEVAGDDALELHSMQAVWVCFTRLISVARQAEADVAPYKRASWFRKAGEALMFFGQSKAAEEYFKSALEELKLDVGVQSMQLGRRATGKSRQGSRRKSWLSKYFKEEETVVSEFDSMFSEQPPGPTSPNHRQNSQNPLSRTKSEPPSSFELPSELKTKGSTAAAAAARKPSSPKGPDAIAKANQEKLLKHQESSLGSSASLGRDVTMNTVNDRSLNRNAYARHQQGTGGRGRMVGAQGPQARFVREAKGAKFLEDIDKDTEESNESNPLSFIKRLFSKQSHKRVQRVKQAELQRNLNACRRVQALPAFAAIDADCDSNVEVFLEASRVYTLLGLLIFDQTSPVGLERRLNAMTLAKAAYEHSLERKTNGHERGKRLGRNGSMVLDLEHQKVEVRELDAQSASLDQLALCYASACLFYAGMSKEFAKVEAESYKEKTMELLGRVRASGTKGKIGLLLGEYCMVTGDFEEADDFLNKSTWIFNFLQFHRDKLESLEIHVTLELFRGRDQRDKVVSLSRNLFQDGVGIFHVNCLCAYVEVCSANYGVAYAYLEQILESSLDFIRSADTSMIHLRESLHEISVIAAELEEPDGLIVLALLMMRRHAKKNAALQLAKVAASIARVHRYEHLPITRFHMLFAIFRIFMESFTPFVDSNEASSSASMVDDGCTSPKIGGHSNKSFSPHSARRSSVGAESSEPGTPVDTDRSRINERNPYFRFPTQKSPASHSKGRLRNRKKPPKEFSRMTGPWKTLHEASTTRKQSVGVLHDLLDIVELYADCYPPCKPYAFYCAAVYHRVRQGRVSSKVRSLLEKCAETAHAAGIQHLMNTALLELFIVRGDPAKLEQIQDRFAKLHAHFEERRTRFEIRELSLEK